MQGNLNHHSSKNSIKGVEILSIGTELLLGNILNTNSKWIAEQLSSIGVSHYRQTTVGDNQERLTKVIKEISLRSNLLITTGGLGPTPDDLTTEAIANAFNEPLFERQNLWVEIKNKLSNRNINNVNSSLRKQCLFPKNAQIVNNPRGIAPGMIWKPTNEFTIITFPGVPSELKEMWKESIHEFIKTNFSDGSIFFSKTLKFAGIGESSIAEEIEDLLDSKNPTVAPYANLGEVKLRITAKSTSEDEALKEIHPIKEALKRKFNKYLFGENNDTLSSVIIRLLKNRNESIVFAESCTGGLLSASITSEAGASEVFRGGIIAYSNELKQNLLGVPKSFLDAYGAVSKEVAEKMAIGVKEKLKADWGIAISGIAGPKGGTETKPIGLVHIAIINPKNKLTNIKKSYTSRRNRVEIQKLSVNDCLNSLRLILLSYKG